MINYSGSYISFIFIFYPLTSNMLDDKLRGNKKPNLASLKIECPNSDKKVPHSFSNEREPCLMSTININCKYSLKYT